MSEGDEEKMKKLLRLLLVAMLICSLVAVAGCAQKEEPAPQQQGQAPAETKSPQGRHSSYICTFRIC